MAEQKGVVVSPNPIKVTEHIDIDGNVIDPVTHEIVKKAEEK